MLLFFAPLLVYIWYFRDYSISTNPVDWGTFGDYIGGVYTVVVTLFAIYLTRHLANRDLEKNKAKAAVGCIYQQIAKIDYQHVDLRSVGRLLRLTKENELYIPKYLYNQLTDLHDDYLVAKELPNRFPKNKELKIKHELKKLYDG